jgi:hypothetical protein
MALPASGNSISLGQVRTEFSLANAINMSKCYGFESGMPTSGEIGLSDYHDVTATTEFKWGWNGDTGMVPSSSGDHTYTWKANTEGTVYLRIMGINGDWRPTETGCVPTGCGYPNCSGSWDWRSLDTGALGHTKGGRYSYDYGGPGTCGDQKCRLGNTGGTTTHTATVVAGQNYTITIPMRAMHNASWFYAGYVRIGHSSTPAQGW